MPDMPAPSFEDRLNAVTMHLEIIAGMQEATDRRLDQVAEDLTKLGQKVDRVADSIDTLGRIVGVHEESVDKIHQRLCRLEDQARRRQRHEEPPPSQ